MLAVTRELKLALIVGFFLVLLVSFLIADHLSASRKVELEPKIAQSQPAIVPGMNTPEIGSQQPQEQVPVMSFMQGAGGGVTTDTTLASKPIGQDPSVVDQIGSRVGSVINGEAKLPPAMGTDFISGSGLGSLGVSQNQMPGIDTLDARGASKAGQAAKLDFGGGAPIGTSGTPTGTKPVMVATQNSVTGNIPQANGGAVPQPVDVRKTDIKPFVDPIAPQRTPEVKVEADRSYTIAAGDSLYQIAKRYYGDGEAWRELAKYNGDRVGKDGSLRPGVKIKIPAGEKIGIKNAKALPKDNAKPKNEVKPTKPDANPTKIGETRIAEGKTSRTYTVKKGDTLSEIAMNQLGTMKRANEIVKLNNLQDAGDIRVGMTLKMPN